jgi:lysophospholipase L1-like esterase
MPRPDKTNAPRSRWRLATLRACTVLFGLLLAGLAAEGGLRLAGIDQSYLTPLGSFFEPDPRLGFRGRPDFSGRFRQADFDVRVVHDARGFRRHEHLPDRLPVSRSVYVLGDSFTWGYGIAQGGVYTDLLQEQLSDCHVRNFALCASGTVQQHAIFEQEICPVLTPGDVVVLAFYANDFSDNAGHMVAFPRLYAELRDGAVCEVPPRQLRLATWKKFAKDSSCLVNLLASCWERYREPRAAANQPASGGTAITAATPPGGASNEGGDSNEDGRPRRLPEVVHDDPPDSERGADPDLPEIQLASSVETNDAESSTAFRNGPEMKITEHYLRAFRDACRQRGARFLVVYIPDPSEYGEHVGTRVAAFSVERKTLLLCAEELGIDTLDLLPGLLREKRRDRALRLTFPGDFHWNARGHALAAAELARAIPVAAPLAKGP